jgi:hypothetical protein
MLSPENSDSENGFHLLILKFKGDMMHYVIFVKSLISLSLSLSLYLFLFVMKMARAREEIWANMHTKIKAYITSYIESSNTSVCNLDTRIYYICNT